MMTCKICGQKREAESCLPGTVDAFGVGLDKIPYGKEKCSSYLELRERCPDCNVKVNGYHHSGCDNEECPHCHGQLISCECRWEEE